MKHLLKLLKLLLINKFLFAESGRIGSNQKISLAMLHVTLERLGGFLYRGIQKRSDQVMHRLKLATMDQRVKFSIRIWREDIRVPRNSYVESLLILTTKEQNKIEERARAKVKLHTKEGPRQPRILRSVEPSFESRW